MGSFYTSHTLRGPTRQQVLDWLGSRPAWVSRTDGGCTTVLDEVCDSHDPADCRQLAADLSGHFHCPVLVVSNFDDDLLIATLYNDGIEVDSYNSSPNCFEPTDEPGPPAGGDAQRLAAAFGVSNVAAIEAVLRSAPDHYVFQTERHRDLAVALGIPSYTVGMGHSYAEAEDWPPDTPADAWLASRE